MIVLQPQAIDREFAIHNQLTRQVPTQTLILETMIKVQGLVLAIGHLRHNWPILSTSEKARFLDHCYCWNPEFPLDYLDTYTCTYVQI